MLSLALSPNYAHDGILFAGTEANGLFRSDDGGQSWTQLAEGVIADAVNGIVLDPQFSQTSQILVLLGTTLLWSCDGGVSWSDWRPGLNFASGLASIAAPERIGPAAPLLVGLIEGGVVRL